MWADYCSISENNAKIFYEDPARDSIGMLDLPEEFAKSSDRSAIKNERERLLQLAKEDGISKPERYLSVAKAADETEVKHFGKLNMMLSKWAHSTAMNVFSSEAPEELRNMFYNLGIAWADGATSKINGFLQHHRLPPK